MYSISSPEQTGNVLVTNDGRLLGLNWAVIVVTSRLDPCKVTLSDKSWGWRDELEGRAGGTRWRVVNLSAFGRPKLVADFSRREAALSSRSTGGRIARIDNLVFLGKREPGEGWIWSLEAIYSAALVSTQPFRRVEKRNIFKDEKNDGSNVLKKNDSSNVLHK